MKYLQKKVLISEERLDSNVGFKYKTNSKLCLVAAQIFAKQFAKCTFFSLKLSFFA